MKNFPATALLFCAVMINNALGQSDSLGNCHYQISGKVINGETGTVMPGALVFLEGRAQQTLSDAKGNYRFTQLCKGKYILVSQYLGFGNARAMISLQGDEIKNIILHSDTCHILSEVVITAKPNMDRMQMHSAAEDRLDREAIENNGGLSLGESLKSINGVQTLQTGPTIFKPVIEGLYGNRILILNNGVRLEGQQWGTEHAPEIDPLNAGEMTVIKGASSVRYGQDAIGGVIMIKPSPLLKEPGWKGNLSTAAFSNGRGGTLSSSIDYHPKWIKSYSMRLQGTVKQSGNNRTPSYFLDNTGLKEYNFSYSGEYIKKRWGAELFYSQFNTKLGVFSGSHIGNLTDLYTVINNGKPLTTSSFTYDIQGPYQQVNHELIKFRTYYKLKGAAKLSLDLSRQFNNRQEFDKHKAYNDSIAGLEKAALELKITTYSGNISIENLRVGNFNTIAGISSTIQQNTYNGRFFIPNFESYSGGIFIIEEWEKENIKLEGGFRYDQKYLKAYLWRGNQIISPEFTFQNFSGTLGAAYKKSEHLFIRTQASTGFRPPNVSELFSNGLHHGAAAVEVGDSTLQSEKSYHFSTGADWFLYRIAGNVNLYYNYIQDYIYLKPELPATLTIRGAFPTFKYSQTNASFKGMDFSIKDSLTKRVMLGLNISLVYAYDHLNKDFLVLIPPAKFTANIKYAFPNWGALKKPSISLSNSISARQSRVPENSDYLNPPPAYSLTNLDFAGQWLAGKQPINIHMGVYNLFNTKYRDYLDRFRYYADAAGINFYIRINILIQNQ